MPGGLPGGPGDLSQVDTGGEELGGEGVSAKTLAAQVLAASSGKETSPAAHEETGAAQVAVETEVDPLKQAGLVLEPEGGAAQKTEAAAAAAAAQETVEAEGSTYAEVEAALAEAGVDLGISAKDLPKDLIPAYEKLVQSAVDIAQNALAKELEASQAIQSVQDFSERVSKSPDKVLLALAINQPEVFTKVAELVAEMGRDPRVKDMVQRDLASEARLMEAERKERAMQEQYRRSKANQVIAATSRLARNYSVPFTMAEKMVAMAVTANKGDIEMAEVENIVKELAKDMGKQQGGLPAKTQTQQVATPAKVAAVKAAPTQPVAGSETTSPASKNVARDSALSPGLKDTGREGGGGKFRDIIKGINARIREI